MTRDYRQGRRDQPDPRISLQSTTSPTKVPHHPAQRPRMTPSNPRNSSFYMGFASPHPRSSGVPSPSGHDPAWPREPLIRRSVALDPRCVGIAPHVVPQGWRGVVHERAGRAPAGSPSATPRVLRCAGTPWPSWQGFDRIGQRRGPDQPRACRRGPSGWRAGRCLTASDAANRNRIPAAPAGPQRSPRS